ncbi:NACHT domain-containing protein, partial [Microbacterium imperiale]
MEAEIAAHATGDPMMNQLIIGLVTDACSLMIQRVIRSARERTRRASRKVDVLDALRWDDRAFTPSIALLAGIPQLDADAVTVRSALVARRTRTVFSQVAACALLSEYESRRDELGKLLKAALSAEGLEIPESTAQILLDILYQLTQLALQNVTSSPHSAAVAEQTARTVLLQATLESIAADVAILSRNHERDSESDREWEERYRAQCVRRHGIIIPPDNNKRTPVPLDEIYVPGRIATSMRATETLTVYDLAPDLDRHVILGDPGGGKSTATNALAHKIASEETDRLPFVVILRDFAAVMHEESIAGYIQRTVASRYETSAPPDGLIERILRHGKAVVLLDGLDELLDPTKRGVMAEKVELFSNNYPSAAVLITSRRVGYIEAQLDPTVFRAFELSAYTDEDVAAYVAKWFSLNASGLQLAPGTVVADVVQAFLEESQSISDLRSNPLLLALLCIIYRGQNYLPRNRVGIYEKCTELLFETWDRSRGLVYDFAFDSHI